MHGVVYPTMQLPVAPLMEPHAQGGLRFIGGAGETTVGVVGLSTAETGIGAVVSVGAIAHGTDGMQSGLRQMWYGANTPSFTEQGITYATGSPTAGRIGDITLGIGLSLGSGLLTQGPTQGGRVTQFFNPALGDFGAGADQALSSPVTLGGRFVDGATGTQTWVAPAAAQDMNWLQRLGTGRPFLNDYVTFHAAAGELQTPGGSKFFLGDYQQYIPGTVSLASRNPIWGALDFNYGAAGFLTQIGATAGREAGEILSKH